jgi:hypothetical protein
MEIARSGKMEDHPGTLMSGWNSLCPISAGMTPYEEELWKSIDEEMDSFRRSGPMQKPFRMCKLIHRLMDLGLELSEKTRISLINLMLPAALLAGQDYMSRHALLKCMTRILRSDRQLLTRQYSAYSSISF